MGAQVDTIIQVNDTSLPAMSSPDIDVQRGRKRRRDPKPPFSVGSTQQVPSGEGTLRGRRRHRSTSRFLATSSSRPGSHQSIRNASPSPSKKRMLRVLKIERRRSQSPSRSRSAHHHDKDDPTRRRRQRTQSRSRTHATFSVPLFDLDSRLSYELDTENNSVCVANDAERIS